MDHQLNSAAAVESSALPGAMPPEAPLSMPAQDLRYKPWRHNRQLISAAVLYARFIVIAVTVGVTTYGVYQMLQVVRFASMTFLQGTMIFFFTISLGWIAFAAGSVLAGASKRRDPTPAAQAPAGALTALVMPIYNEDPTRTTAGLHAMAEALQRIDAHRGFEIVILSDSTDADAWIRETLSIARLRAALQPIMPVWYRRRWLNIARKSGNLEDFVTRWGGRYDHMIVLDADSLIDAPTLQHLAQAMQADPDAGHPADRAAADLRAHFFCAIAAICGLRIRTGDRARPLCLVGGQRQLLGTQRHHSHSGICSILRASQATGPQTLRGIRAVP